MLATLRSIFPFSFFSAPPLSAEEITAAEAEARRVEANTFFKANTCAHCKTEGTLYMGAEGGCAVNAHCGTCGESWNTLGGYDIISFMDPIPETRARYLAEKC